ncbi:hypothetical protein [Mesoterricola silvestris]|uniref:Uncharacterized protein n=1 Tax=Mesoterricola silvestris TaxID=2927979 RepID=A0AA48KCQ3_9BACT|nr:hypothetical protein [Mesoterricola silvestris]BDU73748.1 hypothetical protein METEAL_29220 [Mesoterricola silvestris]
MLHPHVPDTLKHFGKHLLATFLGLLMALGLEQWREHRHDAKVASEALRAVDAEMAENLDRARTQIARCEASLKSLSEVEARLAAMAEARKKGTLPDESPLAVNTGVALDFVPDAWDAFKAQGLLRFLPQERTRRLSRFHRMARALPEMARLNFSGGDAFMVLASRLTESPAAWAKLPAPEFDRFRDGVRLTRLYFTWSQSQLTNLESAGLEALKP